MREAPPWEQDRAMHVVHADTPTGVAAARVDAWGLSSIELEQQALANHDAKGEGKPSNPKDLVGMTKSPLSIVPSTLVICAANALLEGALKYGRYNWRMCGVRASIYIDALGRHIAKWWNGQDRDKKTLVHHLDNAIACLTIIRDAMVYGMLEDDRPPCPNPDAIADLIDEQGETIAHLKNEFKAHQPYQFTIKDTPR